MNLREEQTRSIIVWSAIGALLFFIAVAAVTKVVDLRQDYTTHIKIASGITLRGLFHPIAFLRENCYPVWHILVWLTTKVFGCGGRSAAAVVTGGSVVGTWACAALYFSRRYWGRDKDIARLASIGLILVAPIWLPFFNPNLIIGQGGPNLLHNPTNLMVRFVAFPCFVWYAAIMDGIGKESSPRLAGYKLFVLSLFVFLATLSKPSFVQMFFPAMFLLALFKMIKYRKAAIWSIATVAISFIPSIFLMGLQAWVSFYSSQGDGSGVAIAFMKVYSHFSPNIFVSVMLGILFPLIMLSWSIRTRKFSTVELLAWIMYGVAFTEGSLLIETGRRMWHANFCWGTNLALFFLWFTAIDRFISLAELGKTHATSERNWWFWSAVAALSLHLVSGLCYLWRVLVFGIWS